MKKDDNGSDSLMGERIVPDGIFCFEYGIRISHTLLVMILEEQLGYDSGEGNGDRSAIHRIKQKRKNNDSSRESEKRL